MNAILRRLGAATVNLPISLLGRRDLFAAERFRVEDGPLTWREVADFRERLRSIPPDKTLEVIRILGLDLKTHIQQVRE